MILRKPINLPQSRFFTAGTLLQSSALSSVTGQTVHQEPQRRWDKLLNCKDSHVPEKTRVQTPAPGHMLVEVWHFLGDQTVCHSSRKQCPHASPHSQFLTDDGGRSFRRYFARSTESVSLGEVKAASCFPWFFSTVTCGDDGQLEWTWGHLRNRQISGHVYEGVSRQSQLT